MNKTFGYCEKCAQENLLAPWSWFTLNGASWDCDNCAERARRQESGNIMESWEATIFDGLVRMFMPAGTEAIKTTRALIADPNAPLAVRQLASAATAGLGIVALTKAAPRRS